MDLNRNYSTYNTVTGNFAHIRPLSEAVENIQYWFNELNEHLEKAEADNKYLQSENYKDSELASMQNKISQLKADKEKIWEDARRGFPITEDEERKIQNWIKLHDATVHANPKGYHGVSGGGYAYEFYPTGIGTSGVCYCEVCRRRALDVAYASGKGYSREAFNTYMKKNDGMIEFQELG